MFDISRKGVIFKDDADIEVYVVLFRFGCSMYNNLSSDENLQQHRTNTKTKYNPRKQPNKNRNKLKNTQSDYSIDTPSPQPRSGVRPGYQAVT